MVKGDDGKWAFDTFDGLEEIINRRVGENELQAIETMRAYVDAQEDYASEDRDEDGVEEFAQKLISSKARPTGSTGRPTRSTARARRATSTSPNSTTPPKARAISATGTGS